MNGYVFLLLFSKYFIDTLSFNKVYQIKEETEIGYVIDYVKSNGMKPIRIFNINDTGVDCFSLDIHTGKLSVAKRLDREQLCQFERLKKYRNNICEIIIKLTFETLSNVEKLAIAVEDINDNEPKWNKDQIVLNFNENDAIGGRRSLPEATDLDIGQNGQISYRMEAKDRNYFRLVLDNGLYIENIQVLDREQQDTFELTIIAQDNGIPIRNNKLKVIIEVNDINDNFPKFTKNIFRPDKPIPENILVGTVILSLIATDADSGRNGKFKFYINPNSGVDVTKYFFVKENGAIIVQHAIDYDVGHTAFQFKVVVQDDAEHPYSKSSEAVVEIDIQDVNDEYPQMFFYATKPDEVTRNPIIDENMPVMSLIGQLIVKDMDLKGQDKGTCVSGNVDNVDRPNAISVVTTNEPNEFQVLSNLKFDRESQSEIYNQIVCTDTGNHVSKINLTIIINDVNDHAPLFSSNIYYLHINENQPIGTAMNKRIYVTDRDTGENGEFTLSVEPPDDKLFTVDQREQMLRSNTVFDRESTSKYTLKIVAIDKGSSRLTSSCTVHVYIRDVNDNPVVLTSSLFTFHILENNKPRHMIGTIKATDLDNTTVTYAIESSMQSKFYIEKFSGNFFVLKSLDREDKDVYHVTIIASDGYHLATATATIIVNDINDNSPIFILPNQSNKVMKMDVKETPGFRIGTINATDRDLGDNGLVKYSLKKKDYKETWLNLDSETGDIYLASSLHNYRFSESSIYLDIEACDQGVPKLCSVLTGLEIRWKSLGQQPTNQENASSRSFNIENFLNEYVLILAISGLLVFMIIIMIVFVVVKQKSNLFGRQRNTTNLSNVSKSLMCYPEAYAPPDYRCSTELENLDNDMRLTPDPRITPVLQCSGLYFTDSKFKNDPHQFRCESAPNNISPIFEGNINSIDTTRKHQSINDNYYSKYLTDRYCKISNTESPNPGMETSSFNNSRNSKNHSSFV